MITINVISRTFHLKFGASIGTCFLIDIDSRQYFVTAKHVVENLKDNDEIEIYFKGQWAKLKARLTGHSNVADVSVFTTDIFIACHGLPTTTDGIVYGQDLYFLGFPYGLKAEISHYH